jgi:hypothetical protein
MELNATALDENGVGNKIDHDIRERTSRELDLFVKEPDGFSERSWIINIELGKALVFCGKAERGQERSRREHDTEKQHGNPAD